jgi:hypothetical protein
MSFHIGNFANLTGYPPSKPISYFCVYLLDRNPNLSTDEHFEEDYKKKAPSSGDNFGKPPKRTPRRLRVSFSIEYSKISVPPWHILDHLFCSGRATSKHGGCQESTSVI